MFRARNREFPVGLAHVEVNNKTTLVFAGTASSEPAFLRLAVTCPWVRTAKCRIPERHQLSKLFGPFCIFKDLPHLASNLILQARRLKLF